MAPLVCRDLAVGPVERSHLRAEVDRAIQTQRQKDAIWTPPGYRPSAPEMTDRATFTRSGSVSGATSLFQPKYRPALWTADVYVKGEGEVDGFSRRSLAATEVLQGSLQDRLPFHFSSLSLPSARLQRAGCARVVVVVVVVVLK